ncbi:hypothetical protein RHSIM_Rhsim12G0107000 [Rhododendron simsii]|uniref:Uncharacterized protein n=1 Tax=Rhododendron simsii TaxID=118357 RepID=A0A834G4V4_RHOSS|nr:hypothetical protein RHSIM_Rhsim12G0107000 [Rhododendron simsii]
MDASITESNNGSSVGGSPFGGTSEHGSLPDMSPLPLPQDGPWSNVEIFEGCSIGDNFIKAIHRDKQIRGGLRGDLSRDLSRDLDESLMQIARTIGNAV